MAGSYALSIVPRQHTACLPFFVKRTDRGGDMDLSEESKEPKTTESSDAEATLTPSENIQHQEHSKHTTPPESSRKHSKAL